MSKRDSLFSAAALVLVLTIFGRHAQVYVERFLGESLSLRLELKLRWYARIARASR